MCLAVPGRIVAITSHNGSTRCGRVGFEGVVREVNLACVPEAKVGDFVLVHAGVAIGKVHEFEAQRTLALLKQLTEMEQGGTVKYVSEYRDPLLLRGLVERIHELTDRRWRIMEVCGGQTNTIARYGLDQCLAPSITLLHGPGCPVCVTPAATLDVAQELASQPNVILCSFGDMLRVPGSTRTLLDVKSAGGDVRTLYSPMDALKVARQHPDREVVFFAIGFETTAPLTALAIVQSKEEGIENFSVLCAHVLIPPAIETLLQSPDMNIHALLAPGHVCTVTGIAAYHRLQAAYNLPIVVTGFEPADILEGIHEAVKLLQNHHAEVVIQYSRAVTVEGNRPAQRLIEHVFTVTDRDWRGLGVIPSSGLRIGADYAAYDASRRFGLTWRPEPPETDHCALVLRGALTPTACPAFGQDCTPDHPKGAPMVSAEGACAAYTQHACASRAGL